MMRIVFNVEAVNEVKYRFDKCKMSVYPAVYNLVIDPDLICSKKPKSTSVAKTSVKLCSKIINKFQCSNKLYESRKGVHCNVYHERNIDPKRCQISFGASPTQ